MGTTVAEGITTGIGAMLDVLAGNDPSKTLAARVPDPGLRLEGQYMGRDGFDIEFLPNASVVSCREAIVARDYTVSLKEGRVIVTIQNASTPLALGLEPDGSLASPESVRVDGRVITGMDKNDRIVFQPVADTCPVGMPTPVSR